MQRPCPNLCVSCLVYPEVNISSLITVLVSLSVIILGSSQFSSVQGEPGLVQAEVWSSLGSLNIDHRPRSNIV